MSKDILSRIKVDEASLDDVDKVNWVRRHKGKKETADRNAEFLEKIDKMMGQGLGIASLTGEWSDVESMLALIRRRAQLNGYYLQSAEIEHEGRGRKVLIRKMQFPDNFISND